LAIEEVSKEMKKLLESNKNENITYCDLWDTVKAVLIRRTTVVSAYIKKKRSQRKNILMYFNVFKNKKKTT
jgi:hypothetical protein